MTTQMTLQEALRLAWQHWNAGQAPQAEHYCRQILAQHAGQPDALHLLGLIAHACGHLDRAIAHLREACSAPQFSALYASNLAEMYRQKGERAEGEHWARKAISLDPTLVNGWNNLGILLQEQEKLVESVLCLEKVVALTPGAAQAHGNLANTLRRLGRVDDALAHYQRALALAPDEPSIHNNVAGLLLDSGNTEQALAHCQRALQQEPRLVGGWMTLVNIYLARGDLTAAEQALVRLQGLAPQHPATQQKQAQLRQLQGRNRQAAPADFSGVLQQVQPLLDEGRYLAAETLLRPFVSSGNGPLAIWQRLALALRAQGKLEETLAIQKMLVDHLPGDAVARFDLAETLLLTGDLPNGWREYRHRYQMPHTRDMSRRVQQAPRWQGQPLPGKTLLIFDEQGFGDTLQFIRFVQQAKRQSLARIVLDVHPQLLALIRRAFPDEQVLGRGELPPAFDAYCELMDLPGLLNIQLADLPAATGYLHADPQRLAHWQARLAGLPRPWVALVWAGRPTHVNDRRRSLSLAQFAPFARTDATFLLIQKGDASQQTPPEGMRAEALSAEIEDFDDTAAILSLADLLISVDSSPVHLAGALQCPCWTLLPFIPDWRWLMQRDDSPWYPGMRLFRQPAIDDWATTLENTASALQAWIETPREG
ncbi:tetratricopeptide repeat protein [Kosakonia oryzae]|uniref:tetratricopeptide repeat protein n=1 Tax=Kosakonia oryzae TaxID=497725 RepID=UPI001D0974C7|nr:tetratricopeptide repeat protein [Kosakonia oryzae]